jgi:hypothetical protein
MDPYRWKHYRIEVYDDGPPPDNDPVPMSLCPEARKNRVELVLEPSQVTCRRCRHLLMILGLHEGRPALGDDLVGDDGR